MKTKYQVTLSRTLWQSAFVEVEARSRIEAEKLAAKLSASDDLEWENEEIFDGPDVLNVTAVEGEDA